MASSQVEIIATSSPFGRDAKLKIMRDNLDNLPVSSDSAPIKNTHKKTTWVSRVANKNNNNLESPSFTRRNNLRGDHKDDSSSLSALMSPRHSHIIDRWAARQAQEVIHVESLETIHSRRQVSVSPPRSDGSSESEKNSILGASSLVQMWEKRLNKSNSTSKQNTPPISSPTRTSLDEENCRVSEGGESESLSYDEQFPDWESDKTDQSCSSTVLHCSDVATEREGGKIADIIKRFAVTNSDDNDGELSNSVSSSPYKERGYVSTPKQLAEHKGFCQLTSSPRIRGRQAFNDLMMQFESDRRRELNNLAQGGAVSKFRQRGRIQSLLRLRLLQRGVAAFDPFRHNHKSSAAPEVNKQQGSAIIQLKGRFNMGDDSSISEVSDLRSIGKEKVNSTTELDNFPTSNQLSRDNDIQCEKHTPISGSQISSNDKLEEAHLTLGVTFFEDPNHDLKDIVRESSSMADSNENEAAHNKVEARDQQYDTVEISYDEIVEEDEVSEHYSDEAITSYDWISNISRPRSYWEERRQEWYSEMLDFGSDNDERRKLLERKTVSTVLSSDFRERMDKLMKSHMGTKTHLVSNQYNEEDQEESMEQLMAFFQEHLGPSGGTQEHERERGEEEEVKRSEEEEKAEEQEEESVTGSSDHELCDDQSSSSIHTPASSTWSYRDNDGGDDSDRVAYVSLPLPSQSQSLYQDAPQYSSSTNHPSIEMEFIYDLRGQMEQLFREMIELRKSIKSCTDMQMQIQQSKNQEVHTVKEEEKRLDKKTSKKGNCCICHEKKVNSVLYRCGHMCACLKCANELQWKSGKCPICQAQIIDVVRVYTDTESSHMIYKMDKV